MVDNSKFLPYGDHENKDCLGIIIVSGILHFETKVHNVQ